jgi:hypothetical protein
VAALQQPFRLNTLLLLVAVVVALNNPLTLALAVAVVEVF